MADVMNPIPFEEFSENLDRIFERVLHERETILVESAAGDLVELKPVVPAKRGRRAKSEADHEAFLASLGGCRTLTS